MSLFRKACFLLNKTKLDERKEVRRNIDLIVEYKKNYETKLKRGYSNNISLGGISLKEITDFWTLNTYLNIKIPLPPNYHKDSLMTEAMIVNSKKIKKDRYNYGLKFAKLSNADKTILEDMLNKTN